MPILYGGALPRGQSGPSEGFGTVTLAEWVNHTNHPGTVYLGKWLSGNDLGTTKTHQSGIYLSVESGLMLDDRLKTSELNPRARWQVEIVSHGWRGGLHLIYYNNQFWSGTRNECRLTGFGWFLRLAR